MQLDRDAEEAGVLLFSRIAIIVRPNGERRTNAMMATAAAKQTSTK